MKYKYVIFNETDGVYASQIEFNSIDEAMNHTEKLRDSYRSQGYYRTNNWDKIPPEAIDYSIIKSRQDDSL